MLDHTIRPMFQGTLSTAGDMIHTSTAPQSFKIRISTARYQGASDTKHVCCFPAQGYKLQLPSFKFHNKIQARVSSCNFEVSNFKPRSRSGFQVSISKFQVSNQAPGQGFKLQFQSFKFQTKIQVRV